jgi:membrane associated rhomboid family serine protease
VFPIRDNIPTERTAWVTIGLIVANVLVYFLYQHGPIVLGSPTNSSYLLNLFQNATIPFELTHWSDQCVAIDHFNAVRCGSNLSAPGYLPTWATPFISMFMHGGLLHLGGNMLFLWIFGNNVEDVMGRVKFFVFYILGGLAATALQVVVGPNQIVPNIGASGAIAAVLAAYLLLFPRARVLTFVFIIFFFTFLELPALIFLGIWIGEQILFGYFDLTDPTGGGGGVAYFAHIGGFAFGLLAVKLFASEARRQRSLARAGLR